MASLYLYQRVELTCECGKKNCYQNSFRPEKKNFLNRTLFFPGAKIAVSELNRFRTC